MRRYTILVALSLATTLALVLLLFWPNVPPAQDAPTVAPPKPTTPAPSRRRPAAPPALLDSSAKVVIAPELPAATWQEIASALTSSLDGFDTITCESEVWIDLRTVDPPVSFLLPPLVSKEDIVFIAPPSQLLSLTRRGSSEVIAEIAASDDGCVVREPLRYRLRGKIVMADNRRASTLTLRICGISASIYSRHYSAYVAPDVAMSPKACTVQAEGFVVRPEYLQVPQQGEVTLFVSPSTHDDVIEEADQLADLLDEMEDGRSDQARGQAMQAAFLRELVDAGGLSAEAAAWLRWKAEALDSGNRERWELELEDQALEALGEE